VVAGLVAGMIQADTDDGPDMQSDAAVEAVPRALRSFASDAEPKHESGHLRSTLEPASPLVEAGLNGAFD